MSNSLPAGRGSLWTATLAVVTLFGSYAFACVFPFAALATIAALTMRLPRALALTALVWAGNQFVGYAFMHFPHATDTYLLGIAIGIGALAATAVAAQVGRGTGLVSVRGFAALAAAFGVYELIQYFAALRLGGLHTFAPQIVAGIGLNDLGWFVILAALRLAFQRVRPALTAAKA